MNRTAVRRIAVCLAVLPALSAAQDIENEASRFFDDRVEPILRERCLGCHNQELKNGNVSFLDYGSLLEGGGRGPAVVPGKPDESLLIRAVRQEGALMMPPGAKLSEQDIGTLTEWIAHGAAWGTKLRPVVRIPPANFRELPNAIVQELEKRGCTIPQTNALKGPHNVIRGHFAKTDQIDWAVLCSKNGASTLLIFWKGSGRNPSSIARTEDRDPRNPFTRHITLEPSGNSAADHDGINDSSSETAPVIHYYKRGKWRTSERVYLGSLAK